MAQSGVVATCDDVWYILLVDDTDTILELIGYAAEFGLLGTRSCETVAVRRIIVAISGRFIKHESAA